MAWSAVSSGHALSTQTAAGFPVKGRVAKASIWNIGVGTPRWYVTSVADGICGDVRRCGPDRDAKSPRVPEDLGVGVAMVLRS